MKIYIASSWKNVHSVEMISALLREKGHEVLSFVDQYNKEHKGYKPLEYEKWINSKAADKSFEFDTTGAATSDLVIYISPSGKDAAAEVGIAYANSIPILGLYAKSEDFGLMRKCVTQWFENYRDLLSMIDDLENATNFSSIFKGLIKSPVEKKGIEIADIDSLVDSVIQSTIASPGYRTVNEKGFKEVIKGKQVSRGDITNMQKEMTNSIYKLIQDYETNN